MRDQRLSSLSEVIGIASGVWGRLARPSGRQALLQADARCSVYGLMRTATHGLKPRFVPNTYLKSRWSHGATILVHILLSENAS